MKRFFLILLLFCFICPHAGSAQDKIKDPKRGTIRIKKSGPTVYYINSKNSIKNKPTVRVFLIRGRNVNYKESFPKQYTSELFPLVFGNGTIILADKDRLIIRGTTILSYDYEVYKANVQIFKRKANGYVNQALQELSQYGLGSFVWIRNLSYKDKNGVIHKNEIGEFKIQKF